MIRLSKPFRKPKEYQTIRLFAILGVLTMMTVLLFKAVLFAPRKVENIRAPSGDYKIQDRVLNFKSDGNLTNQNK